MSAVTEELRNMDTEELETRLNETRQELFNLRFQLVTGQLDNSSRVSFVRRHVARIETILREREIAEAEELEKGQIAERPVHREPKSRPITGVELIAPHVDEPADGEPVDGEPVEDDVEPVEDEEIEHE
jgi:large subunit ribosomal protein L29